MPRNGVGTYALPPGNPVTTGTTISSTTHNNTLSDIATALSDSLAKDGQTAMTGNLPMAGNKVTGLGNATETGDALTFAQLFSQGQQQDIASAATTDIGAPLTTLLNVTGTATITSFGTNYNGPRFLRFAGVCTLTNSATLVLPGGANITTAAGDSAIVVPLDNPATGWRVVVYERASGAAFDGSVTTNSIQNDAVTFAKMQNIATGTILGRSTAGTGDVEALTTVPSGVTVPAASLTGDIAVARITNALNASGSAPIYACRAWVNFNGTGTVAIRASGNVSSITDNGTGNYTVNFTTAMPDANYAYTVLGAGDSNPIGATVQAVPTTSALANVVIFGTTNGVPFDQSAVCVAVYR